ncbi:MAG: ribosome rescue protein RqcH [Candidatus Bathyarchaeota archaeon]|nr:ribosome rescue protein RqcH [Candidatus Bathyarchaeota archaeon]
MRKKEFSSFDVAAVVNELERTIVNARVSNIYQLNDKTLLFKLHKPDQPPLRLIIEAGERLHLTSYAFEPPQVPPAFCMALRKHLRGAWIANVKQHEFERIVIIQFRTKEGLMRLVLELFGDGNVILVSEKGGILQALIFKRMRDRSILRNEPFCFPPASGRNPFKVTRNELAQAISGFGDIQVVRALARFLGVGGVYSEEILLRANVEKTKSCNSLADAEFDSIYRALQTLLSAVAASQTEPIIVLAEDGSYVDAVPFKLKRYENCGFQAYSRFNEALDEFYLKATAAEQVASSIQIEKLHQEAERLKRIIAEQEQALSDIEAKAERDRHIGDLIYAHSSELQSLFIKFKEAKSAGRDIKAFDAEVFAAEGAGRTSAGFVESFDARNLTVTVCINELRFSLNLRKTLFENASEYYERGKKAKQKIAGAKAALEDSRRKLAELEQSLREAELLKATKPQETLNRLIKRKASQKAWYEKFRWFKSSEGFLVVAGKDAVSNEVLIKKYAAAEDVVFHADIPGAPFVVVKTEGKAPSEATLREASEFAAAFSRAWREGAAAVDVYWVKPDQLSKSGPSGEYVPHGAFAVSGKRNWLRGVPLRVAIGFVEDDEGVRFIGGPLEAVKAKTKVYVVIAPGDFSGKEFLKQVLQALMTKLSRQQREKVDKVSIEQIREFVPYAKGSLIKSGF